MSNLDPTYLDNVQSYEVFDKSGFGEIMTLVNVNPTILEECCRCQNRRISGRGSRTVRLGRMVTGGRGHDVLPRFGPS